jgi:hypothetical protein
MHFDRIPPHEQTLITYLMLLNVALTWIAVGIIRIVSPRAVDTAKRLAPRIRERRARRYRLMERIVLVAVIVWTIFVAIRIVLAVLVWTYRVPTQAFSEQMGWILSLSSWGMLLGGWVAARMVRQWHTEA